MSYNLGTDTFTVNPNGSIPRFVIDTNQASMHFHFQVRAANGWAVLIDGTSDDLGNSIPIHGGPINSAADFSGKNFFWDITLVAQDATATVTAVVKVEILQDGNLIYELPAEKQSHQLTNAEMTYEFLNAQ